MILCLDSGNSRIKWGLHDGQVWRTQGALVHAEVAGLTSLTQAWPAPRRIMLANVAGSAAEAAIAAALAAWPTPLTRVVSGLAAGGVRNHYRHPERLGVDRWAALVGARSLGTAPALVVMAGTATTIDSLDGDGNFLGGLILPGVDLMRRALARDTAALPLATGSHVVHPKLTGDAIVSGALEATLGAIERAFRRLPGATHCYLSGGNAPLLAGDLGVPCCAVDNLPLLGLLQLARQESPAQA